MSRRRKNKGGAIGDAAGILALFLLFVGILVLFIKFMKLEKPFIFIAVGLLVLGLIVSVQFDSDIIITLFFLSIVPMALYSEYLRRRTDLMSALTEFGSVVWFFAYFTFFYY